ncbi:HAD domain-containing protein [Amycolatopsis cynarae]|uniref:HAD domain-containing protein n=1 Tax=Amycolatopsis cynarae TaxID=2995223 RepID=A0ABY7B4H2_9PSEU|nr:HAD domain-containing protein [Amycolatopsis sp. HUAS 11-8]WAL66324.1 HAD domain-containing protein [Amycolatopsis sp. HUAS 11-8]
MTPHEQRPLLFLDVDGTLLPFGDDTQRELPGVVADSHLERLNPQLGPRLAALGCELIWATTWEQDANTEIAPRLGLPALSVVNWPEPSTEHEHEDQWFGLHWKTRTLVEWADGRPFIWVDDEITDADRDWVPTHHHGPALLHHVAPSRGLTVDDFAVLGQWLRTL